MKIAILMGRGIEGCGVTKFVVEQAKWFKANGHEYHIYSSKDKTWTRKNAHVLDNVSQLKLEKASETDIMITGCNNSDIVIINSLPSISHSAECIKQFNRALSEIKKPIILIQHDHSSLSIKRNACLDEAINASKLIFAHAKTNDFSRYVEQLTGGGRLQDFFTLDNSKIIHGFQPGMDFDSVRSKYWKPIEEQNNIHNKWIGRTTPWKGYKQMFSFHQEYLQAAGFITSLEGIEKSPAFINFKNEYIFHDRVIDNEFNKTEQLVNEIPYVYGPYINDDMLHRMSLCAFGYQLSLLKEKYIERSIEYTHCEVAAIGVIPVFRKAYGELCTHRSTGDKLIHSDKTGTIWLDDNDMKPAFELLNKLSNDNVMRNEYREMAFEYYKSHQDSQYTFEEMMKIIKLELKV